MGGGGITEKAETNSQGTRSSFEMPALLNSLRLSAGILLILISLRDLSGTELQVTHIHFYLLSDFQNQPAEIELENGGGVLLLARQYPSQQTPAERNLNYMPICYSFKGGGK